MGYDVRAANCASYADLTNAPDVVLVRKARVQDPDAPPKKRHWRLDALDVDVDHADGETGSVDMDREIFHQQLETDRDMRGRVNLYKEEGGVDLGEADDPDAVRIDELLDAVHLEADGAAVEDGIDDEAYVALFKPVMAKVMEMYQPDAVVFQSGADSLTGDRLGCFNLSIRGHGECLKYMQTFGVPLLVLGGGGYTIRNVARCWTYETGCLLGHDLENKLPVNDYSEYFGPTHELQIAPSNMENQNTPEYLQGVLNKILENLSKIPPKPSVPFHDVPPDAIDPDSIGRVKEDPDQKGGGAEAEAARRSDPRELEPEDGDRDDKPSRHDASAKEEADGEKKVKEEKVEGAEAVKAELGDAADAKDPEDAADEAQDAGKDAMDVDEEAKSPGKGAGIMASDHGDQ